MELSGHVMDSHKSTPEAEIATQTPLLLESTSCLALTHLISQLNTIPPSSFNLQKRTFIFLMILNVRQKKPQTINA